MIKVKDLMIGDWVLAEGRPLQVTNISILGGDIIRVMNPFMSYDIAYASNIVALSKGAKDINKIEPIPLSEEILHKIGFKNDVLAEKSIIAEGASNFSVILISEDSRITINNIDEYLNSFNKWNVHIDTEDMRTLCIAEITYVHELQHLLKLCKIEKDIVL